METPGRFLDELEQAVGKENFLSGEVDLFLYSYDATTDRAVPSAVVLPETTEQVASAVRICNKYGIPFVARGAATNLCGGTIPLNGALVISLTKMTRILDIDPEKKTALVEPGVPNLFLQKELEPFKLLYAPDPASQKASTIGGNIGTNAGGPHCLKYGVTSHHVLALEVVLADGTVTNLNLNQPGPDITGFFVGSEGTLGIVTKALLKLIPAPERFETMLASFPSLESAIQTVTDIIAAGIIPATLEALDRVTIHAAEAFTHAGYPLDAEAVLLIEIDGGEEIRGQIEPIRKLCEKNGSREFRLARDGREREKLWEGRRGAYPSMARISPNVLVEDGTVPRNRLPEVLKTIRAIAKRYELEISLLFHAGDGNLHPHLLFDERDPEETAKVKRAGLEMLKACVDAGGAISGEHGIGIDKLEAMRWMFTPETLALFSRLKKAFDPEGLCNPNKLIPKIPEQVPAVPNTAPSILDPLLREKKPFFIEGMGTHSKRPEDCAVFSTLTLNKIVEHDRDNFTVTVQAGMTVNELQKILASSGQKVFLNSGGTIGGLIASNPACEPAIRDQILGMSAALTDGTLVSFGGKVMKNVAGYDALKLLLGSKGSLGVIVSVTLKTFPINYGPPVKISDSVPVSQTNETVLDLQKKIRDVFDPEHILVPPSNKNA